MIGKIIWGWFCFVVILFTIYSAVSYWEIKMTINECNQELGLGNWTFTEEHNLFYDKFSCKSYHQNSFTSSTSSIITTLTKTCLLNGKEINCSEIGG